MRNTICIDLYSAFIEIQNFAGRQYYDYGNSDRLSPYLEAMEFIGILREGGAENIIQEFDEMCERSDDDWDRFQSVVATNMTKEFEEAER